MERNAKGAKRSIRKILKDDNLRTETRDALKEEEDRRKRIAEREALRKRLREVKTQCGILHCGCRDYFIVNGLTFFGMHFSF